MKKNLLSIIILALLLVNVVLSGLVMFSVTGASNKTSALVDKIAEAIDLELQTDTEPGLSELPSIADTEVYVISDSMTVPLADSGDGKDHYFVVTVSLSLNTLNEDYETYGTEDVLKGKESLIKSEINAVISKYTLEYFGDDWLSYEITDDNKKSSKKS